MNTLFYSSNIPVSERERRSLVKPTFVIFNTTSNNNSKRSNKYSNKPIKMKQTEESPMSLTINDDMSYATIYNITIYKMKVLHQPSPFKNQNPIFTLPFDIPDTIQTNNFSDFSQFLDFYQYWQKQVYKYDLPVNKLCAIPTTHGMGNKVFGLINIIIFGMLSGRSVEICNWPAFLDYFKMKGSLPIRNNVDIPKNLMHKFENGCKWWPELVNMTISDMETGSFMAASSNCRMLYTLYGMEQFVPRFYQFGIDLSFNNPKGSENYIYNLFLKKIIGPSLTVQYEVNKFTSTWKKYCVLGMHIRAGDQAFKQKDEVYTNWIKKYERTVYAAEHFKSKCKKPIKWFIISDYMPIKEKFLLEYPEETILYNSTLVHTGWKGHKTASKGVMDAVIEIYIYAKCNYRFYFVGTTYAYWGTVIAGKNNIELSERKLYA